MEAELIKFPVGVLWKLVADANFNEIGAVCRGS